MSNRHPVITQLSGGLGNQLFQYFAGLSVSSEENRPLLVDTSELRRAKNNHASSIQSLSLPAQYLDIELDFGKVKYWAYRVFVLLQRLFPETYRAIPFFPPVYTSTAIGFDPALRSLTGLRLIRGYYQSWRFVSELIGKEDLAIPKTPFENAWLEDRINLIQAPGQIAVHVRRGDFLQQGDSWGTLSVDYYRSAIEKLVEVIDVKTVWVFSDSINLIHDEFTAMLSLMGLEVEWVDPEGVQPAEASLVLMARARSIVIANSTFSWWAAMLGEEGKNVVAPSKWFRARPDPDQLIPPNWILNESHWC